MLNHNKYKIEHITPSLYQELIDVWKASVQKSHHFFKPKELSFYEPYILKYIFSETVIYAIRCNKKIGGFICLSQNKVEMLYVHPSHQHKNIGKTLLLFAVNDLKIYKVDVHEENAEAVGFYMHLGYKIISKDKYDGNGKPHPLLHLEYQN